MVEHICTWIYLDSLEESSEYPQVGKRSHLADFQKVYWKCVAVFFALSTQHNPHRRHLLFSNKTGEEIPEIDGFDLRSFLKNKNVELVTLPLNWQTPEGYFGKWRNQFYIFDILEFIEKKWSDDPASSDHSKTSFIILDSDCVINRPLDALFEEIRRYGLLALPMPYDEKHNINGVTRKDMREIYTELDGKDPGENPLYYGGEIFAATMPVIRKINAIAPGVWHQMMERHRTGRIKLNEEAHFLSYCYHKIGSFGSLERFIKRIWTSPQYTNVQPEDANLPIWHLPSEKTGGIALIFRKLEIKTWKLEELGGYLGILKRTRYADWRHWLKYTSLYKWLKR